MDGTLATSAGPVARPVNYEIVQSSMVVDGRCRLGLRHCPTTVAGDGWRRLVLDGRGHVGADRLRLLLATESALSRWVVLPVHPFTETSSDSVSFLRWGHRDRPWTRRLRQTRHSPPRGRRLGGPARRLRRIAGGHPADNRPRARLTDIRLAARHLSRQPVSPAARSATP